MTAVEKLSRSIAILGLSPDKQIDYLIESGFLERSSLQTPRGAVDELALQLLDDNDYLIYQLEESRNVNNGFFRKYRSLSNLLEDILNSPDKRILTMDALISDERWDSVRVKSNMCLKLLRMNQK